ncbi:hypothetical protein WS50_25770 [Burkholderia territorii]|nr:hypothetical protein WS50_25770 [Burkholderia territorii]
MLVIIMEAGVLLDFILVGPIALIAQYGRSPQSRFTSYRRHIKCEAFLGEVQQSVVQTTGDEYLTSGRQLRHHSLAVELFRSTVEQVLIHSIRKACLIRRGKRFAAG